MTFTWPLSYFIITRRFAYLSNIYVGGQHAALDFAAPIGTPIKAIAAGTVMGDAWDPLSGYYIALRHAGGWRSTYRHLRTDAPPAVGQSVAQGQVIGYVGSTGYSSGPHLHFDLWNTTKQDSTAFAKHGLWAHDPELYLGKEEDAMNDADKQWVRQEIANYLAFAGGGHLPNVITSGALDSRINEVITRQHRDKDAHGGGGGPHEHEATVKLK